MFTFSANIYQYAGNSCAAPLFTFNVQIYQYIGNSHVTPLLTFSVQIYQYTGTSSAALLFTCSVQILTPLKMVSLSSSRRFMRPSVSKYDAHCWAFSGSPRCTSGLGGNLVWGQKHNFFCLLSENEPHGGCCRNSCVAKWRTFLRPQASSKPLHLASEAELCSSTEDRRKQKKKKKKSLKKPAVTTKICYNAEQANCYSVIQDCPSSHAPAGQPEHLTNFFTTHHIYTCSGWGPCWWCAANIEATADVHKLFLLQEQWLFHFSCF